MVVMRTVVRWCFASIYTLDDGALIHALASAQDAATTVTMTVTMPVDDSDDSDGDDHSDPEGRHL